MLHFWANKFLSYRLDLYSAILYSLKRRLALTFIRVYFWNIYNISMVYAYIVLNNASMHNSHVKNRIDTLQYYYTHVKNRIDTLQYVYTHVNNRIDTLQYYYTLYPAPWFSLIALNLLVTKTKQ